MTPIQVVNAADGGYVPHTAAMLHSLFTANPDESFTFNFLHKGIDDRHLRELESLCIRHGAGFTATVVPRARLEGLPIQGHFPEEAWYRVFLPQLLPQLDRALWLDSDTIVFQPVRELWDIDLGGLPLAAAPNAALRTFAPLVSRIGIEDRRLYFNSGVMLMDFKRLREEHSEQALREAGAKYREWIRFADQDVLNVVYHKRYRRLRLAWNVLAYAHVNVPETIRVHGQDEYDEAMAAPKIVHFTGLAVMKPWFYRCSHPHREDYLRHRAAAGWPPPDYPDRSLKNFFMRRVPLRLRAVMSMAVHGRVGDSMSYLRQW